ncbi:hypothetical protein [Sabulibacter ruber]|uniref:hypothetical protein n=1 Tax=Sabulibacter ruber TaxID=2811901 RepID=UPI001A9697D0|nr:hypothetical protein [Sabulibacter ruber]
MIQAKATTLLPLLASTAFLRYLARRGQLGLSTAVADFGSFYRKQAQNRNAVIGFKIGFIFPLLFNSGLILRNLPG